METLQARTTAPVSADPHNRSPVAGSEKGALMTHVAVVECRPTSGTFKATWFSEHGGSHGVQGELGRNPIEALRNLVDALERNDHRLADIAAIDGGDD